MAICVKNFLLWLLFFSLFCPLWAKESFSAPGIISTDGTDLVFRELLIEKSLNTSSLNCTVTQDNFENAVKKLKNNQCDMVLVKKSPENINISNDLTCKVFAQTPILVFVHASNKVSKLKISDLRQILNGDINQWSFFDRNNIFSIHRFGMPHDDSSFIYLKRRLNLREKIQHLPLNSTQEIITIVRANPNSIGTGVLEKDLNLKGIKLLQITDDNGRNINFSMPHTVIFRKQDKNKVENFLKNGK